MSEKIKKLWEAVKTRLKKVSKKAYIIIGVVVVVLAAALTFALNNKPYSVLFTGVSPSEASSILSFLEGQGVTDYKVENNDTILVPKGKEGALKARLVMEGYPSPAMPIPPIMTMLALSPRSRSATTPISCFYRRASATSFAISTM